jgi:hypothetical protein
MGYGGGYGGGSGYGRGNGGGGYGGGGQRQPFQKKDGEGKLFEEQNKQGPQSPDFSGYIVYNGEEIRISGWGKQGPKGFSINIKVKTAQRQPPQGHGQESNWAPKPVYEKDWGNGGQTQPYSGNVGYQQPQPGPGQGYDGPQMPARGGAPARPQQPPQQGYGQPPPPPNAVPMQPRSAPAQRPGWAPPQAPPQGQDVTGGRPDFQAPPSGPEYGQTAPPPDNSLPF